MPSPGIPEPACAARPPALTAGAPAPWEELAPALGEAPPPAGAGVEDVPVVVVALGGAPGVEGGPLRGRSQRGCRDSVGSSGEVRVDSPYWAYNDQAHVWWR